MLEATPFEGMATATPEGDVEGWEVDVIPHDASNPFYYYASSTNFYGSLELCEMIEVEAILDGEVMYEGPLMSLLSGTTTVIDAWEFSFSGAVGFPGETCHFDIDFNGWQTRHGYDQGGYSDTETVTFWITDPSVIISKVHFEQADGDEILLHEWVEIYNPSNIPIDISGWQICDNEACDSIPTTTPILPDTFGLIIPDVAVLNEINVPNDVTIMVIEDDVIGDGLEVAADMLQLRTLRGFVADQMNWGESDNVWTNYDDSLWMPGIHSTTTPDVFARIPVDEDTNSPDDFVPLWRPAMALLAPTASSVWPEGMTQTIEWIATNPNGDDDDLRIDLYHIDEQGGESVIVLDTENDGEHDWQVPGMPGDELQVKIVVTSPENALLNTVVTSEVVTVGCGPHSTSSQCRGLWFTIDKKFSGVDLGFTEEQFSFRIQGPAFDLTVPHGGTILLPLGSYTITEIVPNDFFIPDWRLQWSGDTCTGENIAGGLGSITIEERDLKKITSHCLVDNQFRPEWAPREERNTVPPRDRATRGGGRSEVAGTATTTATTTAETVSTTEATDSDDGEIDNASTTEPVIEAAATTTEESIAEDAEEDTEISTTTVAVQQEAEVENQEVDTSDATTAELSADDTVQAGSSHDDSAESSEEDEEVAEEESEEIPIEADEFQEDKESTEPEETPEASEDGDEVTE